MSITLGVLITAGLSPSLQDDPGPILLNTDSLRQFSDTLDYDLDVVVSLSVQ